MGNYFEGKLELELSKTTPIEVIVGLLGVMFLNKEESANFYKQISNTSLKDTPFFKSPILNRLRVEIGITLPDQKYFGGGYEVFDIPYFLSYIAAGKTGNRTARKIEIYYTSKKYNIENITYKDCLIAFKEHMSLIRSVKVYISVCAKGYTNELDLALDFLKPYLIKGHTDLVGYIEDEDCTVKKELYLDSKKFENKMLARKDVCINCDKYNKNIDCEIFKYCNAAYIKGKGSMICRG